jgi:uncharacterized protein YcbX
MSERIAISSLFIYPVKSLRGVAVDAVRLTAGRPAGDREYLVMSKFGQFIDQRNHPRMARVETSVGDRGLRLRCEGLGELDVPPLTMDSGEREVVHVLMFRRSAPVTPTSVEADEWISEALGISCRLMAFVPTAPALNVPPYETQSSLHDATPFHLTSEESLSDLNARANTSLPMNRFRPNLVVRGASAYAEDSWKTIAIGTTVLRWVKSCTRCVATTTDQVTGERMGREPLATLSKYRREGTTVVFGHYFMPERWGAELRLGDEVRILES